MIYFSSDTHFGHNREFVWKARGFKSVEEMNEAIVRNFNSLITEDDDLYLLGDVIMGDPANIEYVNVNYPGTGDIFASVLVGAILRGDSLPIAISRATDFLEFTIKTTYSFGTESRYGVMLERTLHRLAENKDAEGFETL